MNQPIHANELQGAYTALITPMYDDGEINHALLDHLINDQIAAGITGIVACGTTGQSATLSHEEHVDLVEHIYNHVDGRVQFIAGAGSNSTSEAISLSTEIENRIGPTTFLQVTPYYIKPPQEGLIAHYNAIANEIQGNIILYNVPGRTSCNIQPATAIALSNNPRIIGIKQASEEFEETLDIVLRTDPNSFRVLSGEDGLVARLLESGGYGVISASANVAPNYFVQLTEQGLNGNHERAHELQTEIDPLVKTVFCATNPIPLATMFETYLRPPLVRLEDIEDQIWETLRNYNSERLGINLENYRPRCMCF